MPIMTKSPLRWDCSSLTNVRGLMRNRIRPATMAKSMGSREMPPTGVLMEMVLIPSNTTTMASIARCSGQFLSSF